MSNDDVKLSKYQEAHHRLSEIEGIVGAEPLIRTALWDMERHIDGEPARRAAAREEQRAQDIARSRKAKYALTGGPNSLAGAWNGGIESAIEGVLSTRLTATPLADEITALRVQKEQEWRENLAEKAAFVSEVADLRAQVATLEAAYAAISPETMEKWRKGELTAGELVSFGHETGLLARSKALEARVAELEAENAEFVAEAQQRMRDDIRAEKAEAECAALRKTWGDALAVSRQTVEERDALRAQVSGDARPHAQHEEFTLGCEPCLLNCIEQLHKAEAQVADLEGQLRVAQMNAEGAEMLEGRSVDESNVLRARMVKAVMALCEVHDFEALQLVMQVKR